jgi:ATP adenylyltransferase
VEEGGISSISTNGLRERRQPPGVLCSTDQSSDVVDLGIWRTPFMLRQFYPYNPGHLLLYPLRHVEDVRGHRGEERRLWLLQRGFWAWIRHTPHAYNIGYNMEAAGRP